MKECAITCMGQLVAVMGDALTEKMPACLQLLLERLRNEITRLAAVKVCCRKSSHLHIPHALSPRSPPCPRPGVKRRFHFSNEKIDTPHGAVASMIAAMTRFV